MQYIMPVNFSDIYLVALTLLLVTALWKCVVIKSRLCIVGITVGSEETKPKNPKLL